MNKPVRYMQIEEVEYWDCGISVHKHRGKKSAEKCIEDNEMTEDQCIDFLNKWENAEQIESDDLRHAALDKMEQSLDAGDGKRLNYKRSRVLDRARKIQAEKALDAFYGLSLRVRNILKREGYKTLDEVRAELNTPRPPYFDSLLECVPNLGEKGIDEIRRYLNTDKVR